MILRLSHTLRELQRLSREAPEATFQDDAFEAMKELIRFDTGFWGGGIPSEPAVMHYVHLFRISLAEMHPAFEKAKSHPKMIESVARAANNAGRAQIFNTKEAGIDFFYKPFDVDQLISIYLHDTDLGLYHVLSLYRSGEEHFTEQERLLFESAVPHLLDAYRENQLQHISSSNWDSCPLSPAAALVDWEGVVHFARPAFVELIRSEYPDWHGPKVPEAMRRMKEGSFIGKAVAASFTQKNDSLYLMVMRKKGLLDELSARELEVAKQLARGLSHKDIASHLAITPATARNHVASILAKLGCNKTVQVATMLQNEGGL
jgi:DNA-binding CsgD family transcriptional regulator